MITTQDQTFERAKSYKPRRKLCQIPECKNLAVQKYCKPCSADVAEERNRLSHRKGVHYDNYND
jgi:hypothetical protein